MATIESLKAELDELKGQMELERAQFNAERETLKKQILHQDEVISELQKHVSPVFLVWSRLIGVDGIPQIKIGTILFDSDTSACDGESFHAFVDGKGPTISAIICEDVSLFYFISLIIYCLLVNQTYIIL